MKKINKVMKGTLNNTKILESQSDLKICKECGDRKEMEVNILGQKKIVPVLCKCEEKKRHIEEEKEEAKQKMLRLERLRRHSLMGRRFRSCRFKNFKIDDENKNVYKLGKNYCNNWQDMKRDNVGLLLYGPPGTGKTFLAFCIANELLNNMTPVIAISSIGLLNKIKETYNSWGREGEVEVINSLKNASLLVLDDLGAENSTNWAKEKLYEIIDARYRDNKPCIITTNLTREGLKNKLTSQDGVARTYDRIVEMCIPIEIKGSSRRIKTAKYKEETIKKLLT